MSLNDLEAHWDGGWVTTDPPTPDEPRVPAAPGAGSGDVTAANSWFAEPPEPSDEFRASGLSIAVPGIAAYWDGTEVSTTR